jgi:hypothetical protein
MPTPFRSGPPRHLTALLLATAIIGPVLLTGCEEDRVALEKQRKDERDSVQKGRVGDYYRLTVELPSATMQDQISALKASNSGEAESLPIDMDHLSNWLADMQQTRGPDGPAGKLDEAADRLLQSLRPLVAQGERLESYFRMREYLTDEHVRAKAEFPQLLAKYQAVAATYAPFVASIQQAALGDEIETLAFYRKNGDAARYYDLLIKRHTRALLAATEDPKRLADASSAAAADKLAAELSQLVDRDQHAWDGVMIGIGNLKAAPSGIGDSAARMIGSYRKYRKSRDMSDYQDFRNQSGFIMQYGGS